MDLGTVEREYQKKKYLSFLKQYGILAGTAAVGMGILLYGLYLAVVPEKPVVEIVKTKGEEGEQQVIYVDVAGAVEKPGVYQLSAGSRIGDALVAAGGLAGGADREWVAQTINLAEEVKDGGKVYIPARSGTSEANGQVVGASVNLGSGKININKASQSELETLVGIGEARAKTIMDNRSYGSVEELISKAKIPESVYEKFKEQISVY